ncbi:MAG: helix-turn-helix transcriptional regulator [Sphingobium sp.]
MIDLDEIYDAAFDRSRFEPLLRRLVEAMGAQSGFLAWSDVESHAKFEIQVGNDPEYLRKYVEVYWEHDLLRPLLFDVPEGVAAAVHPHLQRPEVRESRFYREYLAPQGIVDNLAINLIKRREMIASLAILRMEPAAPFSDAEREALQALVPHLRRVVFLQSQIIGQANLVRGYRQAAKSTRDGLILLDDMLRVLDIDRDLERLTGVQVGEAIGRTTFGRVVMAAVETRTPMMAQIDMPDAAPIRLLCHAQPIERDPYGDLADGPGVAHAVHATRVDHPWPIALSLIASLHGLTPTEIRVVEDALAHGDITAMGERLGMARATTRTHLHRVYEKTGTTGFADLCLFAHRFILPRPMTTVN